MFASSSWERVLTCETLTCYLHVVQFVVFDEYNFKEDSISRYVNLSSISC